MTKDSYSGFQIFRREVDDDDELVDSDDKSPSSI